MDDVKSWLLSRTIWAGIIGAAASVIGAWLKLDITADLVNQLTDIAVMGVTFVTSVIAVYGRLKASKKIAKP